MEAIEPLEDLSNILEGVFNTSIIALALVGYEMIISIISYPMRARGIIVNYNSVRADPIFLYFLKKSHRSLI